jgi:hypothetical protein
MIRLFAAGAVVAAVMAASAGARAADVVNFLTGDRLYQQCSAPKGDRAYGDCEGYVFAITDALVDGGNEIDGYRACIPYGVLEEQAIDVAQRFLAAHPESRHRGAAGLVAQALAEAFPCSH